MSPLPVDTSRDSEPIRLFESDFLEYFTHISPVTIVVIWVPVIVILSIIAGQNSGLNLILPAVVVGLLLWTLTEYILHRYVFHFEPRTPTQEKMLFFFHGIHHAQPQDKTRLVMPLPVSIPLALLFYAAFYALFGLVLGAPEWVAPVMVGFLSGYLVYDLTHYATHHFPMHSRAAKYLKRHHMIHHYKEPEARFGVSSPLWDWIFGTMGKNK